jgi:hypothetical protein
LDDEKLYQHNQRRVDLGMKKVIKLPEKEEWDEIEKQHLRWQYRIGGEKWTKAIENIV